MTGDARTACYSVVDATHVGEARRAAAGWAQEIHLDQQASGKLAILVTELANNLHRHARDGVILLRKSNTGAPAIELLAVDKGPGMADIGKCFRDGYSTVGTPGTGLGSVVRLADEWDIYSVEGTGTVLMATVRGATRHRDASRLEIGAVSVPIKGETICGDNWAHLANRSCERILVADGLGHGRNAAEASNEAAAIFRAKESSPLPEVMQAIHHGLKKTRGAAVAVAELDFEQRVIRYAGIGNISAAILDGDTTRSLVSHNGTAGHEARKIQEFQYPWPADSIVVLHSDGLLSRWDLGKYPGLTARNPSVVAGLLWRDFTRGRDDVTVVVIKENSV